MRKNHYDQTLIQHQGDVVEKKSVIVEKET